MNCLYIEIPCMILRIKDCIPLFSFLFCLFLQRQWREGHWKPHDQAGEVWLHPLGNNRPSWSRCPDYYFFLWSPSIHMQYNQFMPYTFHAYASFEVPSEYMLFVQHMFNYRIWSLFSYQNILTFRPFLKFYMFFLWVKVGW